MKFRARGRFLPALLAALLLAVPVVEAALPQKRNLNVQELDLPSVVEFISRRYKKIIIPDDNLLNQLKGRKATIIMPPDLDEMQQTAELWKYIFDNILSLYQYTIVEKGDIYRLVPLAGAKRLALPIYKDNLGEMTLNTERIITAVVVLKFNTIDIVRPFFENISTVRPPIPLRDNKTLIVTAAESDIKAFLDVVALLDVPGEEPKMQIYELKRASASQARGHIQAFLALERARQGAAATPADQAFLLPDDRTNRLLVSAVVKDHVLVREMLDFLDAKVENERTNINILRLKNSSAKVVADNLSKILAKGPGAPGAPGAPPQEIPTIVPFEELNALIIKVEDPQAFDEVKKVVELLDVKRNQVFITSSIVEIAHNRNDNIGVELGALIKPGPGRAGAIAGSNFGLSTPTLDLTANPAKVTRTPNIPSSGTMFALPLGRFDAIPLVLQAAQTSTDINVVANPVIICDDNEKALIEINEERSVTTTQIANNITTNSFGGTTKAGIVLSITPTIASNNFLKLVLDQSVDRFIPDPSGGTRDVKSVRHASTTVTIPNKTSVVVGGLTQKEINASDSKVPGLGSIPVLGFLFRSRGKRNTENTVYFFITPEIIESFDEMSGLTKKYGDRLRERRLELGDKSVLELKFRTEKEGEASWQEQRENEYLGTLARAFSPDHLARWVIAERRAELSAKLRAPGAAGEVLLPDELEACFNKGSLDDSFYKTLKFISEQMEAWTPEERKSLVAKFYAHLSGVLDAPAAKGDEGRRHERDASGASIMAAPMEGVATRRGE